MSIQTEIVRYMTLDALKIANNHAVENDLNRSIEPSRINSLSEDNVYPISMTVPTSYNTDSDHLRCRVILSNEIIETPMGKDSDGAWIDVPFDFYMNKTLSAEL